MSEQRKPLSEWIRSFHTFLDQQQFCNISNHATVSLSSSDYLILALRLTCSLADEICRVEEETGRLPTPRVDWMDSIVVHLKSNSSKGDGTENVVNTILTDDDDGIRVEVLPSLFDKTENYASQMDGILYSLGIVFFEIFSRGERPAELEQTQIGETTPNGFEIGTEELSEGFNPFQQGGTFDAGELSMYQNLLSDYNLSDDDSR